MGIPTKVSGKPGDRIVSCTGKDMGVYKRRKKKAYTRPGRVKVIKQ